MLQSVPDQLRKTAQKNNEATATRTDNSCFNCTEAPSMFWAVCRVTTYSSPLATICYKLSIYAARCSLFKCYGQNQTSIYFFEN